MRHMSKIGSFIRKKRQEKNISIRQLAKYTGVSPAYISQIENNYRKNPTTHILRSLSNGLGIEYDEFLLELEQLTEGEVKERKHFYEQYIVSDENSESYCTYEDIQDKDLYNFITKSEVLKYKGRLLNEKDKDRILTMLQTLLE